MKFQVLIDDSFINTTNDNSLAPINNKWLMSICNDFEDGVWRYSTFQNFIWDNIKETALSYKERLALIQEGESSVLTEAAKKLRLSDGDKDQGKGGEIAEILLYGIMKKKYNALPIVPKIFYKQNSQDYAKGVDSVHITLENDDKFALWFGESKFYNSIENARLDSIIASVRNSLKLEKIKKENSIITNLEDIKLFKEISDTQRKNILETLSQDKSIDYIKPILNIPIMLLHECSITSTTTHFTEEYRQRIIEYHKDRATSFYKKQISVCSSIDLYEEIKFHLILFPIPAKDDIVNKFINKAKAFRD